MNAPLRNVGGGPYAPISPEKRDVIAIGRFTVLQPTHPQHKATLGPAESGKAVDVGDKIMFPAWVRIGFVVGALGLLIAVALSIVLVVFDLNLLFWLTFGALAVGVTALAVSLIGAKKHVNRAGRSKEAGTPRAVPTEARSA